MLKTGTQPMIFKTGNVHVPNLNLELIDACLFEKQVNMGKGINLCPVLHWNLN
jgi:hypothetical protein